MKKITLVFVAAVMAISTIFVSCQASYEKSDNGLVYKFHKKGNETVKPKIGDYVTIDMVYGTGDTILFDSKTLPQVMKMPLIESTFDGDVYDAIAFLSVGDSASFIMNADSVFVKLFRMNALPPELDSIDELYFDIKLNNIETMEEVKAAQDIELKRMEGEETVIRDEYLAKNYPNDKPTTTGLYYIDVKAFLIFLFFF